MYFKKKKNCVTSIFIHVCISSTNHKSPPPKKIFGTILRKNNNNQVQRIWK